MNNGTILRRWVTFNAVGLLGVGLQLGVLAALTAWAGWSVPLATLIAVEAAILHNFAWHHHVTWRDRIATAGVAARLVRFHALNGAVSLVGNVGITSVLSAAGMPAVPANLLAIVACATLNFVLGDRFVFRKEVSGFTKEVAASLCLCGVLFSAPSGPATLSAREAGSESITYAAGPTAAALAAWDAYVRNVDGRYAEAGTSSFFALDVRRVTRWRDRAMTATVPMVEVPPTDAPNAKIHHWAGAIYIPDSTVPAVIKRMQDYAGRESEFYQEVKASRLMQRDGDRVNVFLKLQRDAGVVTADYNTEHAVEYRTLSATRASSRSVSTKIAELEHAGTPRERELPAGKDRGFLWRLNAYWRFEQAGSGVFIECESVSLSRGVPWLVRPIASPIVNRIARESLERTLRSLRAFLTRPT